MKKINRTCVICGVEKHRDNFNTVGVKRPSLKHNCKDCENIVYYYLYFKNSKYEKYSNSIKLFLNNLISTSSDLPLNNIVNIINYTNNTYMELNNQIKKALDNCVIYIGQTNNPKQRHRNHIKHKNKLRLHSTIKKYGIDAFYINNIVRKDKNDLDDIEKFSIAALSFIGIDIFNVTEGGEGTRGRKATEEQKLKTIKTKLSKKTIGQINKEAKENGLIFLSTIEDYNNPYSGGVHGIYNWKCIICGHEGPAEYRSAISTYKFDCLYCSENRPKNENDYHKLAAEKNLIWIGGDIPEDTHKHTLWRCIYNEQHIRNTTYNAITMVVGCQTKCSVLEILSFKQLEKYIIEYYILNNKLPSMEAGAIKNTNLNWRRIDLALKRKYYPECIEYSSLPDIRRAINIQGI